MKAKLSEPVMVAKQDVTLTMDKEAATVLRSILERVAGPPHGFRYHIDKLRAALSKIGIYPDQSMLSKEHDGIYLIDPEDCQC